MPSSVGLGHKLHDLAILADQIMCARLRACIGEGVDGARRAWPVSDVDNDPFDGAAIAASGKRW